MQHTQQHTTNRAHVLMIVCVATAFAAGAARCQETAKSVVFGNQKYSVIAEAEDKQFDLSFSIERHNGGSNAVINLLIGYQDPNNSYRLEMDGKKADLFRYLKGKEVKLLAGVGPLDPAGPLHVTIRRRVPMLYVHVNGASAIEVMDGTFCSGAIAIRGGIGLAKDPRYQPVEDIRFSDDFMRTDAEQQLGVWGKVKGNWRFHSVRETNPNADFRRSVNPFSLGGRGASAMTTVNEKSVPDYAMVTTGYPFWTDYEYAVSLKSAGGVAGIAFNYVNEQNHYLVRWNMSSPFRYPSRMELISVRPSGRTVLAEGYADCAADQWYRLGVRTIGRRMQVVLDGDVLFDVVDRDAIGGLVGLYTEGTVETFFDDVSVNSSPVYIYDRADSWLRNSESRIGAWKFGLNTVSRIVGATGPHFLIPESDTPSHYVIGDPDWQNQIMELKFKNATGRGWVGIEFGFRDSKNYSLLRWSAEGSAADQKLQLMRVVDGEEQMVASSLTGYRPDGWHSLHLDFSEPGRIRAYADSVLRIRTAADGFAKGQYGIYARYARGALFDRLTISFEKDQGKEKVVSNEIFKTDPFMVLWSSEKGDWFPVRGVPNAYWHKGDFYGPSTIELPLTEGTQVNVAAAEGNYERGYALKVNRDSDGKLRLILHREGKLVAESPVSVQAGKALVLHHEDEFTWATVGENEALSYQDLDPLKGTLVALKLTSAEAIDQVKVERYHVIDHLFETAPADWVRIGNWEITNRFSCTPTWSHMTARSERLAVLWNKYEIDGDFTIEYYAGMRMQAGRALSYPRTGDINISFCADGKDLSSGYSYLVGAWDRGWTSKYTQLARKTDVVAQTDRYLIPRVREGQGGRQIEVPLIADGRPIHGAWYYIKVRKLGNRFECYFDNELVLTYEDKEPLSGKHFALWTQDNEIVVARMKISYQNERTPSRLKEAPPALKVPPDRGAFISVSSPSHPGMNYDFEGSFQGWKPTDAEQGAFLEIDDSTKASGKSSLKLINTSTGGDFGARVPVPYGLDLMKVSELSFAYRMDASVRANLYLKIKGRYHFIHFTGESTDSEILPKIGQINDVKADGHWRQARFSLGSALRRLYPGDEKLMLEDLTIGHLHEGYLNAAFGGNYEGTSYHLDDFEMIAADESTPVLQWVARNQGPAAIAEYSYVVDRSATTDPVKGEKTTDSRKEFPNLAPGKWYLHVKGNAGDGNGTEAVHYAFFVKSQPFAVASVSPPSGSAWGGSLVRVQLESKDHVYPLTAGTTLSFGGSAVENPLRRMSYDLSSNTVSIDLSHAPLHLPNGQNVTVDLHLVKSGGQAIDYSWTYMVDTSKDETPPAPVVVAEYPVCSFEEDVGSFSSADETSALVVRDTSAAATGKASVRIVNAKLGSNMHTTAWNRPCNVGGYPLLSFDYKIPQEVHSDILLGASGGTTHLVFADTDSSASFQTLGSVDGVVRDDTWHRAEINLFNMVAAQPFHPKMFNLTSIAFGDYGYAGVAPGSGYNIDNFQLTPVVNGKRGVPLSWQSADFSGIKGFSATWSPNPADATEPTVNVAGPSQTFTVNSEGVQYLHLRALDNAGNWSDPAHYRFIVDNSPPVIGRTSPADNEKFASMRLQIPITDNGYTGAEVESLRVSVNGKEFPLEENVTDLNEQRGRIIWEWALVSNFSEQPVPDGTAVEFGLTGVKDFAGNEAPLMKWTSKIDYTSDKEPPLSPEVSCKSQEFLSTDTFTRDVGQWDDWGGRKVFDLARQYDAGKKDYVLALTSGGSRRGNGAYIRKSPYDVGQYPFVFFEYRFSANSKMQLLCNFGGKWNAIQLTGPSRYYTVIHKLPGVAQDDRWHGILINLKDILKSHFSGSSTMVIQGLSIGDEGSSGTHYIDNFTVFGAGKNIPVFQWKAFDPTGIQGFSYQIDSKPDTVPDNTSEGNEREKTFPQLNAGAWYLHLRAQDSAGNWGAPVHYPYYVPG
ncbi:MAG: hypothetical protein COZ05_13630 [Armatimonadetes bacterium CG_4_10_14_3_um_filter_59_10]|nr:MAG: hypothetical protein COZ05_13630 [Armatimonadetes bacterium CG_4_10_14_3_um_filter_59_10]